MGRASLFLAVPPNLAVDKLLKFLRLLRMLRFYCAFEICVIMANQKPEKLENLEQPEAVADFILCEIKRICINFISGIKKRSPST